jgi:hypothetical protein
MKLIDKIEEYFIKRNLKKRLIKVEGIKTEEQRNFARVLNTLRENKVMVIIKDDGIYIRLAGGDDNMVCSDTFVKVSNLKEN